MFAPRRILVPTDFSKFSDTALADAVDLAKQYRSTIYLLHVIGITRQCAGEYCFDDQMMREMRAKSVAAAEDMMRAQIAKVTPGHEVEIITDVREGIPYDEILEDQAAKNIDLIVIASHGNTGLLSYLMGSVAEKVAHGATCPVYLVKAKKAAQG